MSIKTTAAIALTLLAFGGSAMAATHHQSARAHAPRQQVYGAPAPVPFNAYASTPDTYGYGRADVSASEPSWNPSLDRAKGGL